jgi:hypothetical protein
MTRIEYEVDLRRLLYKKWKCAKAQSKLRNTTSSALLQKKGSFIYEAGMFLRSMDIFMKHRFFSLRSMKRREGVFSPKAQKRYEYKVSCIAKNWITNNLHIIFKNMHIEYYGLVTAKLHWSSKNVFTISTNPLLGPSPQLHLTTSSTIDSAILMISIAFFVPGSARGSNGSDGGDSSATVEKN